MKPIALLVILGSALAIPMSAQVQTRLLVTQPVDEAKLVALPHSVHPLAQPRYDRGVVPDSFPANRMLLLLNPPQERQADLQLFLNGVHSRGSASYHQLDHAPSIWRAVRPRRCRRSNRGRLALLARISSFQDIEEPPIHRVFRHGRRAPRSLSC